MHVRTIIIITGPTASGKTELAISLAKSFQGEIINADSVQVYRDFDIGSAKPRAEELAEVPHHLFSALDPTEEFNAGIFCEKADQLIASICSREKLPIICGGTGLYIQALLNGLDSFSYSSIENRYRALVIAILPERDILYQRIDQRVDQMFAQGLLEEVQELLLKYPSTAKPFSSIGYQELIDYYAEQSSIEFAVDKIKQHSRNLAKRQFTWWRNQPAKLAWEPVEDNLNLSTLIENFLNEYPDLKKEKVYYKVIGQAEKILL